ncbi:tetratricopeptide repeat protein [Chryseobacterium shigense]|nr:hypothetical protein [Chryseobacterium shigense]
MIYPKQKLHSTSTFINYILLKNGFQLLCLLVPYIALCQYSIPQIDSLCNTTYELRKKGTYQEAIDLNLALIQNSKSIGYTKGAAYSSFQVGNLYNNMGNYKESLKYLDEALYYNKDLQIADLNAAVYTELGKNYSMLSLLQNAMESYGIAENWALKIPDPQKKEKALFYVYNCQAVSNEAAGNIKSSMLAAEKAFGIKKDAISATRIAKNYILHTKDLAKAKKFLDLSHELLKSDPLVTPYQKCVVLHATGLYYNKNKEYNKATENYLQAIDIAKELNRPNDEKEIYKLLYQNYKDAKEENARLLALEKYTTINDSIEDANKMLVEVPIRKIINEKQEKHKHDYRILLYSALILGFILLLSTFLFVRKLQKRKKKLLLEKERIIVEKEEETQELKQKVNESFDDLIQLAKNNSPEFFTRFREVYTDLINKLLKIDPKLRVSELTLCAYVYLGFNTKDIAQYTFRTISTVRNRKHNLRKKLNIPAEESTELWFKNLDNNPE